MKLQKVFLFLINLPRKLRSKIYYWVCLHSILSVGNNFRVGEDVSVHGGAYIRIGNSFTAGHHLKLHAWDVYNNAPTGFTPSIEIGNNVSILDNCQISCARKIRIGNNVLIGPNVLITDNFHGDASVDNLAIAPLDRMLVSKGGVEIGDNVWIGRNVCIMPGVRIGDGCIIGANAVVTHDISANCVAVGVPARIISEMK